MRFWRNAGITTDTTLTANTLGYEFDWEQAAYASSYPAGRITFSDTTAVGKNHRLSLYRAPSGALVFGAGTVQWSWGLDSKHDRGVSTVDPRIQQATVNILSDMLAQPATLQAGLVPGWSVGYDRPDRYDRFSRRRRDRPGWQHHDNWHRRGRWRTCRLG